MEMWLIHWLTLCNNGDNSLKPLNRNMVTVIHSFNTYQMPILVKSHEKQRDPLNLWFMLESSFVSSLESSRINSALKRTYHTFSHYWNNQHPKQFPCRVRLSWPSKFKDTKSLWQPLENHTCDCRSTVLSALPAISVSVLMWSPSASFTKPTWLRKVSIPWKGKVKFLPWRISSTNGFNSKSASVPLVRDNIFQQYDK